MKLKFGLLLLLICALSLPVAGQNKKKAPHKPAAAESTTVYYSKETPLEPTDEIPNVLHRVMPKYPETARKAGIEGTVWVSISVGEDGEAKEVKAYKMEGGSVEIAQAALDAAKQYKFKPVLKDNKTIKIWVTLPFKFKLSDKK